MAFDKIVGNEKIKDLLEKTIKNNNILHSYLFVGTSGIGKNVFAKEFAQMILCQENKEKSLPCHECKSCLEMQSNNHPDFLQIDSEDGKSIKIEQVRFLQEKIAEKPVTSEKKVYIINDADLMTREAANSLLKTLEEPPEYVTLILITSNENKLLTTIKSRCVKMSFEEISNQEIIQYLKQNGLEHDMTDNMLKMCEGSIGKALKLQENKEQYSKIENIVNIITQTDITDIWKNSEVLYKEKENILELLDYMNVILYQKFRIIGQRNAINAINIVEETKRKILSNANYDMSIDYLLLKLWEELN